MQERDKLLKQFTKGYAKYGTQLSLLAIDLTVNEQLLPKEIMHKLFGGPQRHALCAFGEPISDDCGKLTDYKTRSECSDEAKQAYNCWRDLATKGGAWVLSNGIARTTPAYRPELLWSDFVHRTLLGDTAEQVDNVWKYCAFAASIHALRVDKENEAHRPDEEPEQAKLTGKTKPTSYPTEPVVQSESQSVKLFNYPDKPIVKGSDKKRLSTAQYDVVLALIQKGGETGLTKDQLDTYSGHGDSRKILKRLADSDSDWESVISFPGETGMGYWIL